MSIYSRNFAASFFQARWRTRRFRLGTLIGGSGGAKGGVGHFKNNIRLENLPVAKTAPVSINGNPAQLSDLKPAMRVTLELEVKGDITIKGIHAEK